MTALHIASENDNVTLDKIVLLVQAGVNVHALDSDGLTALDFAKTRTGDDASSVVNYLSQHSKTPQAKETQTSLWDYLRDILQHTKSS